MPNTRSRTLRHKIVTTVSIALILTLPNLLLACSDTGDTESTNSKQLAIEGFASSQVLGCEVSVLPASSESSHYPLECLAWQRNADALVLSITNVHTGCKGEKHTASASMESGSLKLAITGSVSLLCGNCAYDISMTIRNSSTATDLSLGMWTSPETEEPYVEGAADVSPDDGIVCRYASRYAGPPSGDARTLCHEAAGIECVDGTTCHSDIPGMGYCLPPCGSNVDCWQLEQCVEGMCQLTDTW